jgi:hypothetical protein
MLSIEDKWNALVGFHAMSESDVHRMNAARRVGIVPDARINSLHNTLEQVLRGKLRFDKLQSELWTWLADHKAILRLADRIAFLDANVFLFAEQTSDTAAAFADWADKRARIAYDLGTINRYQFQRIKSRIASLREQIASGVEWRVSVVALGRLIGEASAHIKIALTPTENDRRNHSELRAELAERVKRCRVALGMEEQPAPATGAGQQAVAPEQSSVEHKPTITVKKSLRRNA